jgi:putative tricarboxylic transport membrane protein
MNRTDVTVGALFFALGLYLLISSFSFPPGLGALPGPGFFPTVIAVVVVVLSLALLAGGLRTASGPEFRLENRRALAVTVGLLAGFLLLWGVIPFAVRSLVFLALFLRFLGQTWRAAILVGAVLTAAVLAAFQYGLRVSLG